MARKTREQIAATLKSLRTASGYTQKEVGKKFNTTQQSVARWENGMAQPDADTFLSLCDLYGVKDILGTFGFLGEPEPTEFPSLTEKISRLDAADQARVEAYTDGLLSQDKYQPVSSAG